MRTYSAARRSGGDASGPLVVFKFAPANSAHPIYFTGISSWRLLTVGLVSQLCSKIDSAVFMSPSKYLTERDKVMRIKMGTVVPKMGTVVHLDTQKTDYRRAIAIALHEELGSTHRAIKSAMRWTGASERTVKYWFAGERGPRGDHLIALARNSDLVLYVFLTLADRHAKEEGG
jgi:hypothetical protein